MSKKNNIFRQLADLHKLRITLSVTLTTLAGYALAAGTIDRNIVLPLIGVFILSSGSAALNQFQERNLDTLMKRTRNRPLPSGSIKPSVVFILILLEVLIGSFLLYISGGFVVVFLGILALIWYNFIYTPIKKITPFAVIPGSVTGAIPPMIGWVVGGSSLIDPKLFVLAFFFFISQVPHFWLLMLKYGKEYETAGLPTVNSVLSDKQIKRVTFVWIVATSLNVVLLVFVGLFKTLFFKIVVLVAAVWLIVIFSKLLRKSENDFSPFRYFLRLNYIVLVIILSMIIDPLL